MQAAIIFNEAAQKELFWVVSRWVFCAVRNKVHRPSLCPTGGEQSSATTQVALEVAGFPSVVPHLTFQPLATQHLLALCPAPEAGVPGADFQWGHQAALAFHLLGCHLGLWAWVWTEAVNLGFRIEFGSVRLNGEKINTLNFKNLLMTALSSTGNAGKHSTGSSSLHDSGCFHGITVINTLKLHKLMTVCVQIIVILWPPDHVTNV